MRESTTTAEHSKAATKVPIGDTYATYRVRLTIEEMAAWDSLPSKFGQRGLSQFGQYVSARLPGLSRARG